MRIERDIVSLSERCANIVSKHTVNDQVIGVKQPEPCRAFALSRRGVYNKRLTADIKVMAGGLHHAAIAAVWPAFGKDGSCGPGDPLCLSEVAPEHHLAAVAGVGGRGIDQGIRFHGHGGGLVHGAAALPVATYQHGTTAQGAVGIKPASAGQGDVITLQNDPAAHRGEAFRLNHAGIIHRSSSKGVGAAGRHDCQAAIHLDQTAVGHLGINCSFVNRQGDQSVTGKIKGHQITACQGHTAARCADSTFVDNLRAYQGHNATGGGIDGPLIDNASCRATVLEAVFTGQKVCIKHVEG